MDLLMHMIIIEIPKNSLDLAAAWWNMMYNTYANNFYWHSQLM